MVTEHSESVIRYHCTDSEGFVAKLMVEGVFDTEAYRELIAAMREFARVAVGSSTIDRRTAGCLHFLVYTLLLILCDLEHPPQDRDLVEKAHAETWELLQTILPTA